MTREEVISYIIASLSDASEDMARIGDYNNQSVVENILQGYERELLLHFASKSKNVVIFEKKPRPFVCVR